MKSRPAVLVLLGAAVFVIGASLVVVSLRSGPASAAGSHVSPPPVAGTAPRTAGAVGTSEVSIPAGDQAVAITPATGAEGVAGYVGPGDFVDVYASLSKLSSTPSGVSANVPVPCALLVAADVPVIDVSVQVPEYKGHESAGARNMPSSTTLLLAATPTQVPALIFAATNETLYLTQAPGSQAPAQANTCVGTTGATSGALR